MSRWRNSRDPADVDADAGGPRVTATSETMSIGPSVAGETTVMEPAPVRSGDAVPDHGVDAWYEDPRPAPEPEPTWLSRRWQAWHGLDRDRRWTIVLVAVCVVALIAAVLGITQSGADESPVQLPTVESHGLDVDQAACFAFGRIERRLVAELGDDEFDDGTAASVLGPVTDEIDAIDALGAAYPEADYRLIVAFEGVADAAVLLRESGEGVEFLSAVAARASAVDDVARVCGDVSGFDLAKLRPSE